MSENSNTNTEENLNEETKIIRVRVGAELANEILSKINAPTPDASEIQEIHLLIQNTEISS